MEPALRSRLFATRTPVATGAAGKAAEFATQALLITVVPRVLGPAHYGVLALALAVVGIGASLVAVGGAAVLGRFVPAAPEHEQVALARALVRRLATIAVVPFALAAGVAVAVAAVEPHRFPPVIALLVVLALGLEVAATIGSQAALGLGRLGTWTFRYPLQNLVLVAAALALSGTGSAGAAAAVAAASAAGVVFVGMHLTDLRAARASTPVPAGAIRFGLLNAFSAVLILVTQRGAVIAAGLAAGTREAGFAGIAVGAGLALTFTAWWLFTSQLPSLAGKWGTDRDVAEAGARRLATRMTAVYVPLTLCAMLAGRFLLGAVVGSRFSAAGPALAPALAAAALAPLLGLVTQISILRLQPTARLVGAAAGVVAFLVTAAAATGAHGAAGATSAFLVASVVTLLVSGHALPSSLPPRLLLISLAGAAGVLALGWA
jgi:O-antigen/teichoic acid export membrane protein